MELRISLLEDAIILEPAFSQDFRRPAKGIPDMGCIMGVRADGDDFPSQLPIALQRVHAGMEIPHPFLDSAGVQLDAFALVQQFFQNIVEDVAVCRIRISFVLSRRIAHRIVQMPIENFRIFSSVDWKYSPKASSLLRPWKKSG